MAETAHCPGCGTILDDLALLALCKNCLNQRYFQELLGREAGHYAARPEHPVLVITQGERRHIQMVSDHTRSLCDTRVLTPAYKKIPYPLTALPEGVCKNCLKQLAGVMAAAKTLVRKEEAS